MAAPGRLVTLEGGEGVGKSTLARALVSAWREAGRDVVLTREPGGSPGADEIRALIVSGAGERWSALSETLLLAAARRDHVERTIAPALAAGRWVLCDRYIDSTRAYQSAGRGLPLKTVETLMALIGAPTPDLTLILDVDPAVAVARSAGGQKGETRFESMPAAFHARVRAAFREIAEKEPDRCALLDAAAPAAEVAAAALAEIRARLGEEA